MIEYIIKDTKTIEELEKALAFSKRIFEEHPGFGDENTEKGKWLERMGKNNGLMLYSDWCGEVIGIVFGYIEDNDNWTVAIVAVDERFRKLGIARKMMLLVEERAIASGVHLIALGAAYTAEAFYAELGYIGSLLIQSENHSVDELLSQNSGYAVSWTNVYDGKINQVCLILPKADRELQRKYETNLPGTHTQMMFWKYI